MYWPTTPANGEFISRTVNGKWLDPDAYLSAHPNWQDCTLLPTSYRESTVRASAAKPQEDPLAKKGVVGAFCRAFGISEVIDTFLSEIYAPSTVSSLFSPSVSYYYSSYLP